MADLENTEEFYEESQLQPKANNERKKSVAPPLHKVEAQNVQVAVRCR